MAKTRETRNPGDYEVGYKKPPKQHQFRKGESGNQGGRPKGRSHYLADLRRALNQKVVVTENGKTKRMSMYEVVVRQLLASAAKGTDPRLIEAVIKLPLLLPEDPKDKSHFTLIIEGA
jgi:hypothetical protein